MDAARIFSGGRHQVGGVWLGPITLGHALYLEQFNLLEIESAQAFALACVIIETPQHKIVEALGSRWLGLRLWRWARRANERSAAALRGMLGEAIEGVQLMTKSGESATGGAPSVLRLRVFLIEKMGADARHVFDTPLAEALADAAVSLELSGDGVILTKQAIEQARANAAALAGRN